MLFQTPLTHSCLHFQPHPLTDLQATPSGNIKDQILAAGNTILEPLSTDYSSPDSPQNTAPLVRIYIFLRELHSNS